MSKIEVDTIDTQSSTTLQVGSTNTALIKIGTSGDTVEYPAGTTFTQSGTQNVTSGGAINVKSGGSIIIDSGAAITNNGTATGFSADLTNLNATNLTSGTVPDARFPATLPIANGSALTNLNATALTSGTLPDARFPATLPAISGANLTNLTAGGMTLLNTVNVTSGTVSNITTGAIFSATYNSYRIVFDQFKHSTPSALYLQIGNSSGLQASYNWNSIGLRGTSSQLTGATAGGNIQLYGGDSNNDYRSNSNQGMPGGFIDVFNPFVSGANTIIRSQLTFGNSATNAAQQASVGGLILNGTQYDRFKIDISVGSIAATTKILTYGYNL